jgi:hypothetical protein
MIDSRDTYQLYHNREWIQGLESQEIAYFDVDSLENQWMLYKPKYTESATSPNRLKTQKNRVGDILLRKKNQPIGFKLNSDAATDIDGDGRKYQTSIANQTLREVLDGNVYDLKIYSNYGVVFGYDNTEQHYSICFEIEGTLLNDADEEFIVLSVVALVSIDSLYNFVDAIIYNGNFFTITYDGNITLTTQKFNISFGIYEGASSSIFAIDSFNATSENDLSGLSYTPVSSRIVTINGTPTETIGRIWTTAYSDDKIYLAYECLVPEARSTVTGVTEGIALIQVVLDSFLESSSPTLNYYMYDTLVDLSKYTEEEYCQAFIPDYTDEQQSFGHSITTSDDNRLIVGSPEEDAIYVFDLDLVDTPDLFGTPPTTLLTNGIKIEKDYALEQEPVFPIRMNPGLMDFEIFGDVDILWMFPDGTTPSGSLVSGNLSLDSHPALTLTDPGTVYLFCNNFLNGDVTINANNTSGFIGSLNDIPNLDFGIDVSNTQASGHFGTDFQATEINIENTNVNQNDLEMSAAVLDAAENVSGTLTAKDGLPDIISDYAIAAINALKAKAWNVEVNMPFNDIDPSFLFTAAPVSGAFDVFQDFEEDTFGIDSYPVSGAFEWITPDQVLVTGAINSPGTDGYYDYTTEVGGYPQFAKGANTIQQAGSDWQIKDVTNILFDVAGTEYLPPLSGFAPNIAPGPAPTLQFIYI